MPDPLSAYPARIVAAAAIALLVGCRGTPDAGQVPSVASAPQFSEVAFRTHVERLAADEFEGRGPGTEGEKKTLAYIEREFRAAGLKPGMGDSFLQPVPLLEITTHPDAVMEIRGARGSL